MNTNSMNFSIQRQVSVAIENQPGRLGRVGRLLAEQKIQISAFTIIDNVEQAMVRLITDNPDLARDTLNSAGLPVVEVEVLTIETANGVGRLAQVGETMASAEINIEYAYASSAEGDKPSRLIVKTANPRDALEILSSMQGTA